MRYEDFSFVNIPEDQILAKECRHSFYVPPPKYSDLPDLHYIKEIIHTKDGRSIPNERLEYDRRRPFWITRKGFRKSHTQHKEWELASKLQKFESTERHMERRVANALGMPWLRDLRQCLDQPYVYGIDITSTACVKQSYIERWSKQTPYSVAELDIESDVVEGTERPIMMSLSMAPSHGRPARCYTWVTEHFAKKYPDFLNELEKLTNKILVPTIQEFRESAPDKLKYSPPIYDFDFKSFVVKDDIEAWKEIFATAHTWQPDFLSIWNMEYEMDKMLESCERHNVDPATFVPDQRIPQEYRTFNFIKGKAVRITASKSMPIKPAARWHVVEIPATFYIIEQMCVYKQTRMGQQEEASYSLDAILQKELKMSKLHIEEAEHIQHATLEWHEFMQENLPVHYAVYNRFDCIGPQFIDEKVRDLSFVLPAQAGTSDFKKFPSQPRRTCDALHRHLLSLEEQRVMGCTSQKLVDDYDHDTISREAWIITLPAALITEQGLQVITELPDVPTRVYAFVGDKRIDKISKSP